MYSPVSVKTRGDSFYVNYLLSESSLVSTFHLHTTFTTTPFAQNEGGVEMEIFTSLAVGLT